MHKDPGTKRRDGDHRLVQWTLKGQEVRDMLDGKVVRHSWKYCASRTPSLLFIDNEHHSLKTSQKTYKECKQKEKRNETYEDNGSMR